MRYFRIRLARSFYNRDLLSQISRVAFTRREFVIIRIVTHFDVFSRSELDTSHPCSRTKNDLKYIYHWENYIVACRMFKMHKSGNKRSRDVLSQSQTEKRKINERLHNFQEFEKLQPDQFFNEN